ncbi:zinc ribbon domain-containing protein [Thermodesulfobacteriota bacterium]
MKCSQCGFESRNDKNFCIKCETKLTLTCPRCNSAVKNGEIYCGRCGHRLSTQSEQTSHGQSFVEKLSRIQRHLPNGLTEKVLAKKDIIEGKRKWVTLMLCEMEGPASLSEELVPDGGDSIIDQILDILIQKIHRYGGTVNGITDNGLMALFGVPVSLDDAPQRAIRSAWAIHREIDELNTRLEQKNMISAKLRIGIHTGPVRIRSLDNVLRVELEEMENTIGLTSAMVELAKPGSTYLTEYTFKLAKESFRFESLGQKRVKDNIQSINIFRAIGPGSTGVQINQEKNNGAPSYAEGMQDQASPIQLSDPPGIDSPLPPDISSNIERAPWRDSDNAYYNDSIPQKKKIFLVLSIIYLILFVFIMWIFLFPKGPLIRITNIFQNFFIDFIFLITVVLLITLCLYGSIHRLFDKLFKGKRQESNLGSILLREGYLTEVQLDEALSEQELRLGEVLVRSQKITTDQLNQALDIQKGSPNRLGDILKDITKLTDDDINWALSKTNRKLGEILREKGLLSNYILYWVLRRQRFGTRHIIKGKS